MPGQTAMSHGRVSFGVSAMMDLSFDEDFPLSQ
jgi:hypothetical protein